MILRLGRSAQTTIGPAFSACSSLGSKSTTSNQTPADIDRIKDDSGEIEIWTPEELTNVLPHVAKEILPLFVIGAFSGVRTEELLRLDWEDVDIVRGWVQRKRSF